METIDDSVLLDHPARSSFWGRQPPNAINEDRIYQNNHHNSNSKNHHGLSE